MTQRLQFVMNTAPWSSPQHPRGPAWPVTGPSAAATVCAAARTAPAAAAPAAAAAPHAVPAAPVLVLAPAAAAAAAVVSVVVAWEPQHLTHHFLRPSRPPHAPPVLILLSALARPQLIPCTHLRRPHRLAYPACWGTPHPAPGQSRSPRTGSPHLLGRQDGWALRPWKAEAPSQPALAAAAEVSAAQHSPRQLRQLLLLLLFLLLLPARM
eukprot:scaffold87981_cov21-Tisochrysis_lutea.AAC.1